MNFIIKHHFSIVIVLLDGIHSW